MTYDASVANAAEAAWSPTGMPFVNDAELETLYADTGNGLG